MKATRKSMVVMAVVLAVVFAVSSTALARGGYWRGGGGYCAGQGFGGPGSGAGGPEYGHGPGLRSVFALDLSDSQRDQVLKVMEKHQIEMIKARGELIKGRETLRTALQGDTFNEDGVRQAYKKISSLREDRLVARSKAMNEIKAVLTPEQVKQLDERTAGFYGKGPRKGSGRPYADDCPQR